ncbi:MAG: pirin family protein [Candidatus Thorarchaeota archaeon]|nr:pirin family protein [Candidatus Thorarchaeota archaeon]
MDALRSIAKTWKGKKTQEGAGVSLKRVFGYYEVRDMDPFLLLDFFGSSNPEDYIAGFPWHPHRGIETITYMLKGRVRHGDSLGNRGVIGPGEVQWMTAGSGIIHEEMPEGSEGNLAGFQLWANLPAQDKMMYPRYRPIASDDIPIVRTTDNSTVRIIAGEVNGIRGPVQDVVTNPQYLDVSITAKGSFSHRIERGHTAFAFLFEGKGTFDSNHTDVIDAETLVLYSDGDCVSITPSNGGMRFLLISGKPIRESIAWRGPIVMNTDEELEIAFEEYRKGIFLKAK